MAEKLVFNLDLDMDGVWETLKKHVLLPYSEWLDAQGLVVAETSEDKRTHEQLIEDFVREARSK